MPHVVTPVTPRLRQTRLRHMVMPHVVTPVTPRLRQTRLRHMVMPLWSCRLRHGYAKHGYATWLCHCGHVGYATYGYAKHGYVTWLHHIRGARKG